MIEDIIFQKICGLFGLQWSFDDLWSCTVDPDFWRVRMNDGVPRGPRGPTKL